VVVDLSNLPVDGEIVTPTDRELVFYTDRSAVELDDKCGMAYWLNRKEGGKGIVPKEEPFARLIGRETHEDLHTIAKMEDISPEALQAAIDDILSPLTSEDKLIRSRMEILYRRLGWLAAFALFIEPRIRQEYDTIQVEDELILDRDPLWVAFTPDRVLKHKKDGRVVYREYKTTISASQKWLHSWFFAIQMHIGLAGIQEELPNEKIGYGEVMGLMKGYASAADGHLSHPYVWGWYNNKTGKWTHEYSKSRTADWEPMPVWEYPDGIVSWVMQCGEDTARQQFPHSPPIFLNKRMLDEWVARRTYRERILRSVDHLCQTDLDLRALHYERRQGQCRPPFGDACPYLKACWNADVYRNPGADSDYEPRQPHHDVELTFEA